MKKILMTLYTIIPFTLKRGDRQHLVCQSPFFFRMGRGPCTRWWSAPWQRRWRLLLLPSTALPKNVNSS